jgi:type IV pilus assembly protein PilM
MAIKLTKGRTLPIGVDLGTAVAKLAQLRQTDDGHALIAAGSLPMPPAIRDNVQARIDYLGANLASVLRGNPFVGKQCIISPPSGQVFVQHVKMPKLPAKDIPIALATELQNKLPFAADDAIIRHLVAGDIFGDDQARQEVIAIAVSRSLLERYLAACRRGGLDVVGVNIDSCAIIECFSRLFRRAADAVRTILFIDVGAASTQVVLSHGDRMVFARCLPRGESHLDAAVAAGLGVPAEQAHSMRWDLLSHEDSGTAGDELYRCIDPELDALGDELTQCLRYYESVFRNETIERAIFVGGQAYDKRLCQLIAQRINLPAQIGDPLVRIRRDGGAGLHIGLDRRAVSPDWAVAVGLSLGSQTKAA